MLTELDYALKFSYFENTSLFCYFNDTFDASENMMYKDHRTINILAMQVETNCLTE